MRLYGFQYLKYEYLISSFGGTLTKELTAKIIAGKKNNKYVITIFFIRLAPNSLIISLKRIKKNLSKYQLGTSYYNQLHLRREIDSLTQ